MKKNIFNKTARLVILTEIFEHFESMTQWDIRTPNSTAEYLHKAEALIELLEVDDCGSVGGFDRENRVERKSNFAEYDRFLALVKKYHTNADIESVCDFTVDNLTKIFIKFSEIRDNFKNNS